jgi:hypothetical protein
MQKIITIREVQALGTPLGLLTMCRREEKERVFFAQLWEIDI